MSRLPAEAGSASDPIAAAIEAFQRGVDRERSFRTIFERFHAPVRRFFARRGVPAEECPDLTQEVFLGIYRGLASWRPEARFETWLFHIANTTWLKRLRHQAANKRAGIELATDDIEAFEPALWLADRQLDRLLDGERQQALHQAVTELPAQMRKCLTLRLYHDLKYREIASLQRISLDTVKAHLFQARQKLKLRLSDFATEELPW